MSRHDRVIQARFHDHIDEIDADAWNALRPNDNPFVSHAFLGGLERTGCILPEWGWQAHHLGLYEHNVLVAAAPLYLKGNSHGEFVFDWSWASAWERAGGDYYPKLLNAVPYSPVTGPRLLVNPDNPRAPALRRALVETMQGEAERLQLSSIHANFLVNDELSAFGEAWLTRGDVQFHWHNHDYADFDAFLATLNHKKRKNIRQERKQVAQHGLHLQMCNGTELDSDAWQHIHALYSATFDMKGNHAALTAAFFQYLGTQMGDAVNIAMARDGENMVAMALFLKSADTLYGRYWGARVDLPGLHFELCYYRGIEYAIANRLAIVRARRTRRAQTGAWLFASAHAFATFLVARGISFCRTQRACTRSRWRRCLCRRLATSYALRRTMIRLPLLDDVAPGRFPDPRSALAEPNGLLAFGGDLSPARLLSAYAHGIFPWFNEGDPILWWSPDPRCVFRTAHLKPNRSLRRALAGKHWHITVDRAFRRVMEACAAPRRDEAGTWISPMMIDAYGVLHDRGHAHSVEVWDDEQLVGGVYGIAIGRLFYGESMFSTHSGGSKIALCALAALLREWSFPLIDAQVTNPHLLSLGAEEWPRDVFLDQVACAVYCSQRCRCVANRFQP